MRTKNSIINISVGLGNQVIITSLSFVSRTVFINTLGVEYLGINALFTNILAMLALAEAGIGSSIMYSLYKPVADNEQEKINVLMRLYRNAYLIIALIVLLLGLSIIPFLDYIVKDTDVKNVNLIYLIFLLNTVSPYLYLHKNSFLNVCQKNYIVTGIYSISSIVTTCLKIGILYYTENYILFLLIESVVTISTTILLSVFVNKMYPYLKNKITSKLESETKREIIKNVKAIVLQNIGTYLIFGTDNIIISSFVSITAVGLYANYNMLIEICRTFTYQIFNNIYHSVGNLVAKESKDKIYSVYKVYRLLAFWLYSVFSILMYILVEPFISLWIGSKFLLSNGILLILVIIFFERGMRNPITTVKSTSGIFHDDRYAPLGQAVINLVVSIVLVKQIGIVGVFLGTLISAVLVPFWTTPFLVYKKVFGLPLKRYYYTYFLYLVIGLGTYYVTSLLTHFITVDNFTTFIIKASISMLIPNLIYLVIFYRTSEFKYLLEIAKNILSKLPKVKYTKGMSH
jgi:O-antigen/teichoic acid export membrane protein